MTHAPSEPADRYRPPQSPLDAPAPDAPFTLATRGSRFLAATADALLQIVVSGPIVWQLGFFEDFPVAVELDASADLAVGAIGFLVFVLLNGWLLYTRSQSIGKWLCGIQIADLDGRRSSFARIVFVRSASMWLGSNLPGVGQFVALADVLPIFGKSRRCLHDYLAKTIVIRVRK